MEQRSDVSYRCSWCTVPIGDDALDLREHGEANHVGCVPNRTSSDGPRAEPAAVLCVMCLRGISSTAELDLSGSVPRHVRCRPSQQTAALLEEDSAAVDGA
jgi:hypothetical protein